MDIRNTRPMGFFLVTTAILGLVIMAVGIISLWQFEARLKVQLDDTLVVVESTVAGMNEGLILADQSLDQTTAIAETLAETLRATGESVENSIPLLESVRQVTTIDLPDTIRSTQVALDAVQASAQVIDTAMGILRAIPFLGLGETSEAPLGDTLKDVSTSLDDIPATLLSMDESLSTSSDDLAEMPAMLTAMAGNVDSIQMNLKDAKAVTDQFLVTMASLEGKVATAREKTPGTLDRIALMVTLVMLWLAMTQVGLLVQGMAMLRPVRVEVEPGQQSVTTDGGK